MTAEALWAAFRERARAEGFAEIRALPATPFAIWREETAGRPHARWSRLSFDPEALLPGAKSQIIMAFPYAPYAAQTGEAEIDAYYPAFARSREASFRLAGWLGERGFSALADAPCPRKPAAALSGLGSYGRNGLIAIRGQGSRVALQSILTDARLPFDEGAAGALSTECLSCSRCVRACPAGALDGSGRVDAQSCLRALPEGEPLPLFARPWIGGRLIGCDICQSCCPRNGGVGTVPAPEALSEGLRLDGLLRGEVQKLEPFIGRNYARKKRLQARACVIAANLSRTDLLESVRALTDSDYPALREHAIWAAAALEREKMGGNVDP